MTPSTASRRRRVTRVVAIALAATTMIASLLTYGAPSAAAQGPTVTITPPAGQSSFAAGDQVTVTWTGMPPGPVSIYQCASPSYLAAQGLAAANTCQLSTRVVGEAGPDGSGSASFQIWWQMRSAQTDSIYCHDGAQRCAVRVTSCPHSPEQRGAVAVIPSMTLEEDPETGDLLLPDRYRFQRPKPTVTAPTVPAPKPTERPKVNGAGGTGIQLAVEAWRAGSLGGTTGVDATYAPRFFDEGYKFLVEGSNDFAMSAVPLRGDLMQFEEDFAPFEEIDPDMSPEAQRQQWDELSSELIYVPVVASPLDVIVDHAPFGVELESLNLDPTSLARMYSGGNGTVTAIDSWGDAAIRSQNPECPPIDRFLGSFAGESGNVIADESGLARAAPVRATNRSDSSESNFVLREWLKYSAPELAGALGPPSASAFKDAIGKVEVTGSRDTAESFSALNPNLALPDTTKIPPPGRIGYVDHAFALKYANRIVRIRNASGEYVAPSVASATATLGTATVDASRGLVSISDGGATPGAYPMVQIYYAAVSPSLFTAGDAAKVDALRDFLAYAISDEGQGMAMAAGYVPLTPAIRAVAAAQVDKIRVPSETPTTTAAPVANPTSSGGFGEEGVATGGFGSVSDGYSSGSYYGSSGGAYGSGGSDYLDSVADAVGDYFDGGGEDGGSVNVEDPSALDVLGETLIRPVSALSDILTNPTKSPGLFVLMVGGAACCLVGPFMYRRRRPKEAAA